MPPAMNQLREAVSIPVESRMSPRTPRRSSRSPQTEHKPNAMNPAYMLTMARPIASNLSAVPSDASPQPSPGCTRAPNRATDAPAHLLALIGAGRRGRDRHLGPRCSGEADPAAFPGGLELLETISCIPCEFVPRRLLGMGGMSRRYRRDVVSHRSAHLLSRD